ncbi:uncharacterized protein LOC125238016 [Leguminivora glycinivorella]|uniref:uncharacterized protein LOC125238016 n=1 Tax=Leguminivora glycinivorella TaxID=1035111 RepID=UPI00200D77F6|nr:uncharacterized protein LOC125238016 [Leguminivora glycinivorella]
MKSIWFLLLFTVVSATKPVVRKDVVPVLTLDPRKRIMATNSTKTNLKYLPFIALIDKEHDTSEYWRATELLSLIRSREELVDYSRCKVPTPIDPVRFNTARNVHALCRDSIDFQLCPQCAHFSNTSECELFRDSCKEKRVSKSEYATYCDRKYGKWRTIFIPADYSQCRCCDECVFYRELDESCVHDEFDFDSEEFLPVSSIDFRAGCNPYLGHPEQESRALRCDKTLRRCVPMTVPTLPKSAFGVSHRSFRYEPVDADCPSCRGYICPPTMKHEPDCHPGAFVPDRGQCNCCGHCSSYFQLNQKCAEFKESVENGSSEIEVEEELLEPGCDDGLVCRQGFCQDIHAVHVSAHSRKRSSQEPDEPYEPCKREMKLFKKKYGQDGHLHYEAPQCTPLWLYAPVQCRRFLCYCAMEDGTPIEGVKVPRVEVSNMNCDCAREKCSLETDVQCDGFGNYKEAMFTPHVDEWSEAEYEDNDDNLPE